MTEPAETPAAPQEAQRVFHVKQLPLAVRYAGWLAGEGTVRGLIGPREVPRLWERHILNCAVVAEVIGEGSTVADVGSGAGLPGLVLAIARPDLAVTLIEPLLRRSTFLDEVVADLGLGNVEVVRARADALHGTRTFDVVTSRAVASLPTLLEWCMPLVAASGALVAMKGSSAADEISEAGRTLAKLGCGVPEILSVGDGILLSTTTVVRVPWADPSQVSWRSAPEDSRGRRPAGGRRRRADRGR